MTQVPYRANLSSTVFPMTLAKAGRTVIIGGSDQNYDRRIDPEGSVRDIGIPQLLYCENILPTPNGFQSIGYISGGTITLPSSSTITAVSHLQVPVSNPSIFTFTLEDTGDSIELWEKNPIQGAFGASRYSESVENPTVGNDSAPSYELREDETRENGQQPWLAREFRELLLSSHIRLTSKVMFSSSDATQSLRCAIGLGTLQTGAGLKLFIDGVNNSLYLAETTNWQTFTADIPVSLGTLSPPIVLDTWYEVVVDIDSNTDETQTITGTVVGHGEVSYTAPEIAVGNCAGIIYGETVHDSPISYASMFWDSIRVEGDGIGYDTTIESISIAFFSNNTAKWSHSELSFENLQVSVPPDFISPASQNDISIAQVRGVTYICIRSQVASTTRIYKATIAGTNITLTDLTTEIGSGLPSPYTIDSVIGIVGSFNYLILLTKAAVFWSSTTSPTDFVPSLVSGAGFEFPSHYKGNALFARVHSEGFFIYTAKNVIFAAYTGNARYPWKFREIPGSGGYELLTQSSGDTNSLTQIGVTITGQIQELAPDRAINIASEASNFLERSSTYDRFSSLTNAFSLVSGTTILRGPSVQFQVYNFLDRYILIPYGLISGYYEYILIYDTQLKRYGKLNVRCNFIFCNDKHIFFVRGDTGQIDVLNFDIYAGANGFALFGKFQYVRGRWITLEELELESTPVSGTRPTALILSSFDGKNLLPATSLIPVTEKSIGNLMWFPAHITAQNFCVLLKGAFDLCTLAMKFVPHGKF